MDGDESTLKVPDNFEISKVELPEIPDDVIFPDELNRYLREQIRYYMHENGMLQKNLSEAESNYNSYKNTVAELELKLRNYENGGNKLLPSTQVASLKIVELSKKLREKSSEVEVLKTKNSKLQQIIFELKESPEEVTKPAPVPVEKPANELEETIRKLEEKLSYTSNKLTEARNLNMQLKNDLKLSNKWLQQEVGENFDSLQSLTSLNSGWRGRAQIIIDLQQKNSDLREKLKNSQDKVSKSSIDYITSKAESKISLLSKENGDLKAQYEELRKKYENSRARCRVLENESTLLKSKYSMIKEQSERDQEIISTLSRQISNTKDMKSGMLKEKDNMITKMQKDKDILVKQVEEYKLSVKRMRDELEKTNEELKNLNNLQACHKCGNTYQQDIIISRLEAEREKLLELTEMQSTRLQAERDALSKVQTLLRYEKQRAAKAEAAAATVQVESNSSRSGYSTSSSSIRALDFTLKDQLELAEENIKALQTRLEIEQLERKADIQEFVKVLKSFESTTECNQPEITCE